MVDVSTLCCVGVVFMQPGVKVNGAYYCYVLLLKHLLATFAFQCVMYAQEH